MVKPKQIDRIQWGGLILGMIILGCALGWHLHSERVQLETTQRLRLADQGRVIEENLSRQLDAVNQVLVSLQQEVPRWTGRKDGLSRHLEALNRFMPGVRTLFILDREGTAIAASRPELIGQPFQSRAYFQLASRSNDPTLFHVSPPIRNALGTFAIDVERSITDPHGRFAGLVAATLDPAYFTTLLHSVIYAPDMWSSLAHADGTLFIIVPDQGIPFGGHLAQPGSLFSRHMESGRDATVLIGRLLANGQLRMAARRNIQPPAIHMDAPLVVAVTRDLAAIDAPWRRDLHTLLSLYLLIGLTGWCSLLVHRRRRHAFEQMASMNNALVKENDERMQLFFDRPLVGMAFTSPQKGWLKVNDRLCQMFGYSREELAGMTWAELTHPDDLEQGEAAFMQLAGGAMDHYSCQKRYLRKDGTFLYADLSVGCVRRPDGALDYVLELVADITERVRIEQELMALNLSLESRVQDAVTQLRAKDQILIAQSRLAAMGEMIGNIAHQWRQPLNALSMVMVNLRDAHEYNDLDAERMEQYLTKADTLIQNMSGTITVFRDFFRPGKERIRFSALEQVRATVELMQASFQNKAIVLAIEAPQDLPLHGLPNEFAQVLLNLLSNAKDAILGTGSPQGRITLRLEAAEGFGCLKVRDTGGGIPEAILDRIFEPYFSTREAGTGIGLYMARRVIEQSMNGQLTVRNVSGGAEFTVRVPLAGDGA